MMQIFLLFFSLMLGLIMWSTALTGPSAKSRARVRSDALAQVRHEALNRLGLDEAADAGSIRAAHKRLMLKYHPDHGGSHQAAARLNQARDILLRS
jgi:hypothetical protein